MTDIKLSQLKFPDSLISLSAFCLWLQPFFKAEPFKNLLMARSDLLSSDLPQLPSRLVSREIVTDCGMHCVVLNDKNIYVRNVHI